MTLLEKYRQDNQKKMSLNNNSININLNIPEIGDLLKHLEMLYSNMILEKKQPEEENMVDIVGMPMIQTKSWYNQGDSKVKYSIYLG